MAKKQRAKTVSVVASVVEPPTPREARALTVLPKTPPAIPPPKVVPKVSKADIINAAVVMARQRWQDLCDAWEARGRELDQQMEHVLQVQFSGWTADMFISRMYHCTPHMRSEHVSVIGDCSAREEPYDGDAVGKDDPVFTCALRVAPVLLCPEMREMAAAREAHKAARPRGFSEWNVREDLKKALDNKVDIVKSILAVPENRNKLELLLDDVDARSKVDRQP
jgi:hypothetical protein